MPAAFGACCGGFYFQSDEMAIAKERSYAERVRHGVFYALGIAPVLVAIAFFLGCPLVLAVGAWIVLSAMHGVIDFMIRPRIKRMTHGEVQAFLLDQALHVGCCVVAGVFFGKECLKGAFAILGRNACVDHLACPLHCTCMRVSQITAGFSAKGCGFS